LAAQSVLHWIDEVPSIEKPSVQSLLLEMRVNGNSLAVGTGFTAVSRSGPVLITNRHNVTGRHQETGQPLSPTGGIPDEVVILHNVGGSLGTWTPVTERLHDASGKPLWHEHPTLGAKADFVALPLTNLASVQIYEYDLTDTGPNIAVKPAEIVSVVGFPFGMTAGGAMAIWATGFVASEPELDFANLPVFLIDCRSRPGQSGSAVVAHRAGGMVAMSDGSSGVFNGPVTKFLGIYSGRINDQSDIGIVWKASAIATLIASI
jgi:hypothetical protein